MSGGKHPFEPEDDTRPTAGPCAFCGRAADDAEQHAPAPARRFAEALTVAARAMLDDAHDEATALAMAVEEAAEALGEPDGVLRALGTLANHEAQIAALATALNAARALLLRARGSR